MMPTVCDVCGADKLTASSGMFETHHSCDVCYSTVASVLYRKDGKILTRPAAWGRCVAAVSENHGLDKTEPGRFHQATEWWYVFEASDGTLRRAYLGGHAWKPGERPAGVPERVEWFHWWQVDLLTATGG